MFRRCLLFCAVALTAFAVLPFAVAQKDSRVTNWIWFDEGDPLESAPAETRYFRRTFDVRLVPRGATLRITADNHYAVWLNGKKVGSGDDWSSLDKHDVGKLVVKGKNVLAVEAKNDGGPAGLAVRLDVVFVEKVKFDVHSDGDWKSSKEAAKGWQALDFDDGKWAKAKVLGEYGKVGPWGGGGGVSSGKPPVRKFTVPEGYKVEEIVKRPDDRGVFSLVNMTFDDRGRLLVSHEQGGILLCTKPDDKGVLQEVRDYCTQVTGCHGMCWVKDSLYLVGNGPKGTGLYRCRDTKKKDEIDEVTLIHSFQGGMGEHGPHAVVHGPDDMLYVVIGNHAWAKIGPKMAPNPEKLASNSPLLRWPTGGQGPDQGKEGSTEDVLLPRLNDANGHAANVRAPGGTIWRMDLDGKNVALVVAGFRNQFDAAFNPDGELFSFDSDMEWDEGLPWYRPVRVVHCPPGADFVWRTGAANTPNYYLDSLPPVVETGRGSPVGVTICAQPRFGSKYQGTAFVADWSIGAIYAVHLQRRGATYAGSAEKFCVGSPMPVTDLEFAKDGSLVFTVGGRGSQGGVYRIVKTTKEEEDESQPAQNAALARARRVWKMGVSGEAKHKDALIEALSDEDALVRRRACEALIRAGIEPDAKHLWPLLADKDHFVCTAARLVLQRIDPKKWVDALAKEEKKDLAAHHAIIALCLSGHAEENKEVIFRRLVLSNPRDLISQTEFLRTVQLACFHVVKPPASLKQVVAYCEKWLPPIPDDNPSRDVRVLERQYNRELAIVMTHFRRAKLIGSDVHATLLKAMQSTKDRQQQIHFFYCLRLLHDGWTKEQKDALVAWYESTQPWNGGASFKGFLANIFADALKAFDEADLKALIEQGEKSPHAALAVVRVQQAQRKADLLPAMKKLAKDLEASELPAVVELRKALEEAICAVVSERPRDEDYALLLAGLSSSSKSAAFSAITGLRKVGTKPKADDPNPHRAALEAARKLDAGNRWQVVLLLRHWSNGRQFGHDQKQAGKELAAWAKWFNQSFPKESPLPEEDADAPTPSKYDYKELLTYLTTGDGKTGDVARGRKAFEKASCLKCHKFGKEGEGMGPELSAVSKRFARKDLLESIYYPSKVISDQYRSTTIVTVKGQTLTGLVAVQGETLTVLQQDGSKTTLRGKDVDKRFASLTSVMPEKLLDPLTKQEIADLFAFLESEPLK